MAHGAGGKASRRLVEGLFAPLLFESSAEPLGDAAQSNIDGTRIAITTDSFVVKPLQFSRRIDRRTGGERNSERSRGIGRPSGGAGGDICSRSGTADGDPGSGSSRHGERLRAEAGVTIVGGDTKVVEHGKADRMYITTTGIGAPDSRSEDRSASVRAGDKVLLSGPIGDHGITILLARGELDLEADLRSDTRSVLPLVEAMARAAAPGIRWMRDPLAAASRRR